MSLNPEQLLQRGQVSDPLVTEALVQQDYAFVYRLALSILDDPDEAEDATQETFIAPVMNLDRCRGEGLPRFETVIHRFFGENPNATIVALLEPVGWTDDDGNLETPRVAQGVPGVPDGPLLGRHLDLAKFACLTGVEPPCDLYTIQQISGDPEAGFCG